MISRHVTELMFTGQTSVIAGLLVDYGQVPERTRSEALAKLSAALRVIGRFDGRRARRLVHDRTRILLITPVGASHYDAEANVIVLEATDVVTRPVWRVASTLVHEAGHARLRCIPVTSRNIARIERRCVEEEIAFVHRLPPVDPDWMTQYEASKRAQLDTPWWTYRATMGRFLRVFATHSDRAWLTKLLKPFV
jgi:hypothetical protein